MLATCCGCRATVVTFAQIQEQVVHSGFTSISYDSGEVQQVLLTKDIGFGGNPSPAESQGTISGNDISALVSVSGFGGQAFFTAKWQDSITVTGLPPGTPVDLLFTESLNSSVSLSGTGHASAVSGLRLFLNNPVDLILCNAISSDGPAPCATDDLTQTASRMITVTSGGPHLYSMKP